jgi:hypothetical protein
MMKLYYLHANADDDDANFDLMVWANSVDEAIPIWRDYYWPDQQSNDFRMFPQAAFVVPLAAPRKPGAVRWHKDITEITIPTKVAAEALGLKQGALS